jgi:hypothetical protein
MCIINIRDIIDISDIIWSVMMLRATPRRVSHESGGESGAMGRRNYQESGMR